MEKNTISLLDIKQACNFLCIKQSRIRTAILKREIPFIKIGRLIRFDPKDLTIWLESLKSNQNSKKY